MVDDKKIKPEDIPQYVRKSVDTSLSLDREELPLKKAIEKLESFMIKRAIEKYGSQRKAARALGVNQSTIVRKMKKYGIKCDVIIHQ